LFLKFTLRMLHRHYPQAVEFRVDPDKCSVADLMQSCCLVNGRAKNERTVN